MICIGKRFPRFSIRLAAALSVIVAATPSLSSAAFHKVLEDVPGRLVMELNASDFQTLPVASTTGSKVTCSECHTSGKPGGPDLPVYRFDVITGPTTPTVTLQVLESETLTLPAGISSLPFHPTPATSEFKPNAELYRQAGTFSAHVFGVQYWRGVPVRGVEVPLTVWSEENKTLKWVKRIRVQLDFGGVLSKPASMPLSGPFQSEVKNPVGGSYLYQSGNGLSRTRSLAKRSATSANLGERFIKIKVGDKVLENFDEDRVYGISFSDLAKVTREIDAVPISNLRMYTGINDTLPRAMDSTQPLSGTLREIPIEVFDNDNDGTFDDTDSIRFFGHGTSIWKRLRTPSTHIKYEFSADPYSFENYYYLGFEKNAAAPLRLQKLTVTPATMTSLTSSYSYLRAEKDLETAACDPSRAKDEETGFDWHWFWKGDCLGNIPDTSLSGVSISSRETATLPDLMQNGSGDSLFLGLYVYGSKDDSAFGSSTFVPYFGGQGKAFSPMGTTGSPGAWFRWTGPLMASPAFQLDSLKWKGRNQRFEGYTIVYRRKHLFSGKPLWIFPEATGKPISYQVENGAGQKCARIEDGIATALITLDAEGKFSDSLPLNADAKYLVYKSVAALSSVAFKLETLPAAGSAIRNLETGDLKDPEYIILAAAPLLKQAIALRDYRNNSRRAFKVKTEVVLVEDVYRQYSSGRMSVTAIRDFLRYAYYGWGNASNFGKLKYVVFFGDGHYDYRNIRASLLSETPPNHIPPYEFIDDNGREEIATDDFYAVFDPGESANLGGTLDISTGRIPVQTPTEAADYLKKIADFENPALGGEWRGRVVMAADDHLQRGAPGDIDPITSGHTTDSDNIGKLISANQKGTTVDKVYLLDYPLNSAYHKPEATQDLLSFFNRGSLLINYVGHGASNQWADEALLQTTDALSRMRNEGRNPMVNAFSCTVGRFESLLAEGMSEQFIKQRGVGAIAAVSATRESYPTPNIALARAFYSRTFPSDSSGKVVTAGDALRNAKSSAETSFDYVNDLKYGLLGEPVLLLRKPQLNIEFTQVMDTIKALDCSTIQGRIIGGKGNGKVNLKIIAGSNQKTYINKGSSNQEVDKRGNILFERTFAYQAGVFSTEYFIPKQISFGDSTAKVMIFAWDDSLEMEGTTAKQNLHIQGTAASACASDADGKGPRIRITGCEKKETGELDFPNRVKLSLPYCLQILVEDSSGGVLSAEGPDEGTTIEIPGVLDPFHPLPGIDELYKKAYQFSLDKKTIKPGTHLLKVSARDGYGNMGVRQMQMDLTIDSSITTLHARNVPNPMKRNGTTFYFGSLLPSPDLSFEDPNAGLDRVEYEIRIFNQSGNLVRVFPKAISGAVKWDGRDNWGGLLANGVYFYKITARLNSSIGVAQGGFKTVSSRRNTLIISR